jgi:cation-transporting P-type ATPase 13A2
VPVTKTPLQRSLQDPPFDIKEHARHILYCGTNVIQTKSIGSEDVHALVIRTGIINTCDNFSLTGALM